MEEQRLSIADRVLLAWLKDCSKAIGDVSARLLTNGRCSVGEILAIVLILQEMADKDVKLLEIVKGYDHKIPFASDNKDSNNTDQ